MFLEDVRKVLAKSPAKIQFEYDRPDPIVADDDMIRFNGVQENGHETFLLRRAPHDHFDFCKTNRKPYDTTVVACLLVAKRHFGNWVRLHSDGDWDENPKEYRGGWVAGVKLCKKVLKWVDEDFAAAKADIEGPSDA